MAVAPDPESNNAAPLEFGDERIYLPVVLRSALEYDSQFNASDSM
jgi:hypothetical protein